MLGPHVPIQHLSGAEPATLSEAPESSAPTSNLLGPGCLPPAGGEGLGRASGTIRTLRWCRVKKDSYELVSSRSSMSAGAPELKQGGEMGQGGCES